MQRLQADQRLQIACAVLNKYFSFTMPESPIYLFWYTREYSCSMIVANIPLLRPLLRWAKQSYKSLNRSISGNNESETPLSFAPSHESSSRLAYPSPTTRENQKPAPSVHASGVWSVSVGSRCIACFLTSEKLRKQLEWKTKINRCRSLGLEPDSGTVGQGKETTPLYLLHVTNEAQCAHGLRRQEWDIRWWRMQGSCS